MSCLRPSPPLRPGLSPRDEKRSQRHTKRKDDKWHEDDALILRVIEAYCTSAKTRYTVNSIDLGQVSRTCGTGGLDCRGVGQQQQPPNSPPPLSPFGDLRLNKGQRSNWCCGLAIKAIKKNIDFDC
ncbi:rho guanine nucleotide exchange factor 6-like isoform X2 [Penaeus indicus]